MLFRSRLRLRARPLVFARGAGVGRAAVAEEASRDPGRRWRDVDDHAEAHGAATERASPAVYLELARHLADRSFGGSVALVSGADRRLAETVGHLIDAHALRFAGAWPKPLSKVAVARMLAAASVPKGVKPSAAASPQISLQQLQCGLEQGVGLEAWFQPKVAAGSRRPVGPSVWRAGAREASWSRRSRSSPWPRSTGSSTR